MFKLTSALMEILKIKKKKKKKQLKAMQPDTAYIKLKKAKPP